MLDDDGIPSDFPWDDCRMLYSNPNGFAVKFLHGKCDQDYQFLVRSAYVDAKSIISEWIKLRANPADEPLTDIVHQETDFAFLGHIFQRAAMLPGEQFFLLISIVYLSQCRELNGLVLIERFIALHNQINNRNVASINVDAPDLSWIDLAELLADSLDEIRPTIASNLPPGALVNTKVAMQAEPSSKSSKKRAREEDDLNSNEISLRKRRTRNSSTYSDFEGGNNISNPIHSNGSTNVSSSSSMRPVGGLGPTVSLDSASTSSLRMSEKEVKDPSPFFVIPKGLSGLLHACQGLEFAEEGTMEHIKPVSALNRIVPYRSTVANISELVSSRSSSYTNLVNPPNAKQNNSAPPKQSTENTNVKLENRIRKRRRNAASSYFGAPSSLLNNGQLAVVGGMVVDSPTKVPNSNFTNEEAAESADAEDIEEREKPSSQNVTYNHSSSYYHQHGNKREVTNAYNMSQMQPEDIMEGNTRDAGVARRQKKNKKMFHLLLLDMDNWQGHYAGVCSAAAAQGKSTKVAISPYFNHASPPLKADKSMSHLTKLDNVPILEISEPISIKGVVSLASQRFRVQLNAFQNEKKKFSRNCNDLHEALWIFEVTLLISDGPKSLEGQLKIGNYFPFCHLGHRFFVYSNPLEYFMELARQVTGFLHRAEVFPEDLIHLAVSYLDHMIMGPKELMSEEELQLSEDILATYHPQFMHLWTPVIRCFREKDRTVKDVLAEASEGKFNSILDLLSDPNTPPLMRIPKLVMQPLADNEDQLGGSSGSNIFGGSIYTAGNVLYYSNTQASTAAGTTVSQNYGGSDDDAPGQEEAVGPMHHDGNEEWKKIDPSSTNLLVTKLLREKRQNRAPKTALTVDPSSGLNETARPNASKQKRSYARLTKPKIAKDRQPSTLQDQIGTIESNSGLLGGDMFGGKPSNSAIYSSLNFPVSNGARSNSIGGGFTGNQTNPSDNYPYKQQHILQGHYYNDVMNMARANVVLPLALDSAISKTVSTSSTNIASTSSTSDGIPTHELLSAQQQQLMNLIEAHSFDPDNDQASSTSLSSQASEDQRAAHTLAQILTNSSTTRS